MKDKRRVSSKRELVHRLMGSNNGNQTGAGTTIGKYTRTFFLKNAYCNSCKNLFVPNGLMISLSEDDPIKRAELEHRKGYEEKKHECIRPVLVITIEFGYCDTAALEAGEFKNG